MNVFIPGKMLTVRTKTGSYPNMLIRALPHDEAPEMFDAFTMQMQLKEVLLARDEFSAAFNPKNPSQAKTVDIGEVQPVDVGNRWASKKIKW